MQRITATLINMYQWEPTLFEQLQLPAAVNKDDFIMRLLIDSGEQEVTITHPEVMKRAIGAWCRGKLPAWNKILNIEELRYNPIWNVDGEVVHTGAKTDSRNRSENEEKTGDSSETTTGQLAADNSESWANDTKSTTETEYAENTGTTEQITGNESDNWTEKRTGNIGVTTTQKMMNEEKEFWENWDSVGYLIREFTREFCLLVF